MTNANRPNQENDLLLGLVKHGLVIVLLKKTLTYSDRVII